MTDTAEVRFGSPPQTIQDWLTDFASENDYAASHSLMPWNRAKFRGQAWAFRTARDLIGQAQAHGFLEPETAGQTPLKGQERAD